MFNPFFCTELDPGFRPSIARVEMNLRWALLFLPQLAIDDAQLVHTQALHGLLADSNFAKLMRSRDARGRPHIVTMARASSMPAILRMMIDEEHGGENATIFASFNKEQVARFEQMRKNRRLNLEALFSIAPELQTHCANAENNIFVLGDGHRVYPKNTTTYVAELKETIPAYKERVTSQGVAKTLGTIEEIIESHQLTKTATTRSHLWRAVENAGLTSQEEGHLKRFLLSIPYYRMIAKNDGCELVHASGWQGAQPHTDTRDGSVLDNSLLYQEESHKGAIPCISDLTYIQLLDIRNSEGFADTSTALETAMNSSDSKRAINAVSDHVKLLEGAIERASPTSLALKETFSVTLFGTSAYFAASTVLPEALAGPMGGGFSWLAHRLFLHLKTAGRRSLLRTVGQSLAS